MNELIPTTAAHSEPEMAKLDPMSMPLKGLHIIEASAGTGKTWTLAALYVRLVLGHAPDKLDGSSGLYPPQILVMTFTEAATAELRGRIRTRLAQAARFFGCGESGTGQDGDADDFLRALRADYQPSLWSACAHRLDMAAQWMDDAAIFTIHGWCSRMLKSHAFDSTSLFQQSRVDDSDRLKTLAAQDYWRKWFYPLSAVQLEAIQGLGADPTELLKRLKTRWDNSERAPAVDVGAGASPHELLQGWTQWQLQRVPLEQAARAAWSDAAVARLQDAAAAKTLKGYRADWLAGWLKHMDEWVAGEDGKLETLERFGTARLVEKGWSQAGEHAVFGHLDALCALLRLEPDLAEDLLNHAQREIGAAYRRAKTELAQFDFSDLLQCLYFALKAEDGRLASAIRAQYPVALVDEFQDTDPWQYGALSRIYVESPSADTGLIMIGDPKQAIYSFRGADLQTYLSARHQVQAIHTLSGNYRSTSELVTAVNHVFTKAQKPFGEVPFEPVVACNDQVVPLRFGEQQLPAMTVWHLVHDKTPTKPQFLRTMAEIFATRMVALLNEGWAEPGSMAVLVRNGNEARAIRNELSRRGVRSVYLSERDSVFDTTEATDLWRILRTVSTPRNTHWMRAALSTRLWGLPWSELETLLQDEDAWDAQVDQFHDWQKIWQKQGLLPMLHQLLHAQSIPRRMLDQGEGHDGERRLTNVLHLGDLLQAASASLQGEGALVRYLEEQLRNPKASGDAAQLRLESDANLVQVVTVHKAKGLQYPLVFLPFVSNFMAERKDSGRDDGARLAEDIRLLYVALTRAEQGLWLGVAQVKGDVDGDKPQVLSALSAVLQRKTEQDLAQRLQVWAECADILVASAPEPDGKRYTPATPLREWKAALTPKRVLASRWWTASFSAISRDLGHGAATPLTSARDERMGDDQIDSFAAAASGEAMVFAGSDDSALKYNSFPAGASYGTLLHDLLEWQTNRSWPAMQASTGTANDVDWQALLARKGQRLKLDDAQRDLVDLWIRTIVQTPLPMGNEGGTLVLGALDAQTAWAEMAFTLPVHRLGTAKLDQLICHSVLPGQMRSALQPRQLEGMLTGFMDMVLEHEGRYYVLDYKSNWLASYSRDCLRDSILAHRYDVQYTLYLLALHRLLKSRLKDYDYDRHVGGALYLFLRGIDQPGAGLFVDRPPKALIESLDAAFSEKLNPAKAQP